MKENNIDSNDRFVRWQQVLREHLTFLNNLILTLSIGTFAFLVSLLGDKAFVPICYEKFFFTAGLILTIFSNLMGLATAFSRLLDFRTTVKKIKSELKNEISELEYLKKLMGYYQKTTWYLFYSQIIIFCLAILCLATSLVMIYHVKLF